MDSVVTHAPSRQVSGIPHALAHSPEDNVAVVVVEGFEAGTEALVVVTENNSSFTIASKDAIPIGHKLALKDFAVGDTVIKYGQDVGKIVASVDKGKHVHTHNLKTKRW